MKMRLAVDARWRRSIRCGRGTSWARGRGICSFIASRGSSETGRAGERGELGSAPRIARGALPSSEKAFFGIEILKPPWHAPRANAICERVISSVRQACLDHLLLLHEKQLQRVLHRYVSYFNRARPPCWLLSISVPKSGSKQSRKKPSRHLTDA